MSKIWILLEGDYYDNENRAVGVTSREEVAKAWESSWLNSIEEMEIDNLSGIAYGFPNGKVPGGQ